MKTRQELVTNICLDYSKILFASIGVGHFIYPDKINLLKAIVGITISGILVYRAWLMSPEKEV